MARIYMPGEVWRFKSRDHEPDARVFIVKVDRQENGEEIFHVALDNLAIKNHAAEQGLSTEIAHLPVSRACLEASLREKLQFAGRQPDVGEGYERWHAAFAKGEAGVFDIPLARIVAVMEEAIAEGDPIDDIDPV